MKLALKIGLPVLALALGIVGAFWLVAHRETVEPVPYKKRSPLIEVKEIDLGDWRQPVTDHFVSGRTTSPTKQPKP